MNFPRKVKIRKNYIFRTFELGLTGVSTTTLLLTKGQYRPTLLPSASSIPPPPYPHLRQDGDSKLSGQISSSSNLSFCLILVTSDSVSDSLTSIQFSRHSLSLFRLVFHHVNNILSLFPPYSCCYFFYLSFCFVNFNTRILLSFSSGSSWFPSSFSRPLRYFLMFLLSHFVFNGFICLFLLFSVVLLPCFLSLLLSLIFLSIFYPIWSSLIEI
jgi:hypothetical protein